MMASVLQRVLQFSCRITLTLIRSVVVLSLCIVMGIQLSVTESDCSAFACTVNMKLPGYVKTVSCTGKSIASEGLPCCSVSLVKRYCNVMAQELPNLARV
jgi:hypothetical protein